MSLILHFFLSHLNVFRENMGDINKKHGERFHQDISTMYRRYQGALDCSTMVNCMWVLVRDDASCYRR